MDKDKVTPEALLAGFEEVARARANFVPEMQRQVALLDPFFVKEAEKLLAAHPHVKPEDKYFLLGSVIDASNQAKVLLRIPELLARWNAEPDLQSRRFLGQGMELRSVDNRDIAIEMADAYIKSLVKDHSQSRSEPGLSLLQPPQSPNGDKLGEVGERIMHRSFGFVDAGVWGIRSTIGGAFAIYGGWLTYQAIMSGSPLWSVAGVTLATLSGWFAIKCGKFAWRAAKGEGGGLI